MGMNSPLRAMRIRLILPALAAMTLPIVLSAASVAGSVKDQGGHPLRGATVSLTALSRNEPTRTVTGDEAGQFRFTDLKNGAYSLEASVPGFVGVRYSPITIRYPFEPRWEFVLPIGEGAEGGVYTKAELSGELFIGPEAVANAEIAFRIGHSVFRTKTNQLGQYAIALEPTNYRVTVHDSRGRLIFDEPLDISVTGDYKDPIVLKAKSR